MKKIFLSTALMAALISKAQDSTTTVTTQATSSPLTITGYAEAYYSYDFNKPANNTKPGFLYNHTRHNEFNANLAFVKAAYATERVRANVAVAVGTYMNANYAAEPGTLKNIFEANAGYKISRTKNLWLDVGIMPSHIGFETAIGKDNWTLTRSLVAENSPYFESGAKLSYTTDNGRLQVAALALNGWQRITRVDGNSLMSWGTQVFYKPSDNVTLNYSTFFGTDKPDSNRLWRYYHNVYGIFQFASKLGLIAGFDLGQEQKGRNSSELNTWYTPVGILRYTPSSKWAVALRGEYYSDKNGVIIGTGTPNGFRTSGWSVNVDYLPIPNVALRLEGRTLRSRDDIFTKSNGVTNNNNMLTFATAISF